jgi:hypothetical protein
MQSIADPLYHAKVFILDWVLFAMFILFVIEFLFTKIIAFWHRIRRLLATLVGRRASQ